MTIPSRPNWQPQGPANRCVIAGRQLGWLNCTPTATAMGIEKSKLGANRPSGCNVRAAISPADLVGGTTLPQCAGAAAKFGVTVDVHVGANVASPKWLATQLQAGRGVVLQGNTGVLAGSGHRSTGTGVNHAVWVNEVRGGTLGYPNEALVYDPAADGRSASWGKAAQGPQWWPWNLVVAFGRALHPYGESDPRTLRNMDILGLYAGVFPDTEPHVHLHYGATRTTPFPDRVRVDQAALWAHTTPNYGTTNRVTPRLERDDLFVAYQHVKRAGELWLGNHDGGRWVPASKVRNVGGQQ